MWLKPTDLHDRNDEWARLTDFLASPGRGTRLGIVYGRRRQGKTTLLEALCDATGGFYWQARERELAQNLASLGDAWLAFRGAGPSRFESWAEALKTLATAGSDATSPVPVVIDEFGYLIGRDPGLASELQAVLSPRGAASTAGQTRLILCGSALGQMRRLLDPDAALRGRAALELVIQPFDYRTAAEFWGLSANPDAAFRLDALVGGTPAYLDLAAGHRPTDGDIDGWVVRRLLDPSSALFREGRMTVSEDQQLGDGQLYWAVLAAIAGGANKWSTLSAALGGREGTLSHAIDVLRDAGWIERHDDPLRAKGSTLVLTEPIVRFQQLVVEPFENRLRRPNEATSVWNDAQHVVRSQIYARHLERLSHEWIRRWASPETVGGEVDVVASSSTSAGQLDLVALERTARGARHLIACGEVKSGTEPVGVEVLERLDAVIDGLARVRSAATRSLAGSNSQVRRIIVARAGFTHGLVRVAAARSDVELVDTPRLYTGT